MLERRELLKAGIGVVALASTAAAADEVAHEHSAAGPSSAQQALVSAIGGCLTQGNLCLQHCLVALGGGDTTLAECSKTVRDMLAVCSATQTLVAGNSAHAKAAVQLCIDACSDCEGACRKHAEHHAVRKACADACTATIKAARAFLA